MKAPEVTVLMPVYNGEKYLKDAIESILSQDFRDLEFLIINDGSSDSSEKIIRSYSDPRICLVNNEKNIGLVNTLNRGLALAKGKYVARMDCDDVSLKERLSVQVAYLEKHSGIAACGSFYHLFVNGNKRLTDLPVQPEELKSFLPFNCPVAHPTVMIRMSVIKDEQLTYRGEFLHAEDYDLWSRLSEHHGLANIPKPLLNYRVHPGQITENKSFADRKRESLETIRLRHLKLAGIVPSAEELNLHHLISDGKKAESDEQVIAGEAWLRKIVETNKQAKAWNEAYLGKIVLERWLRFCYNYFGGMNGFSYCLRSDLYRSTKLPLKQKLEFFRNIYNSFKRKGIK